MGKLHRNSRWTSKKLPAIRGVQKTRGSQLARNSLEKSSKKARLEIGSVFNEPARLGSVCKRAQLELRQARLVSSRASSIRFTSFIFFVPHRLENKN
ncbi:hypothetical protein Hanom_Chr07g00680621 [Helianthus anomalus]